MSELIKCSAVYPTLAVHNVKATSRWYVERLGFKTKFLWGEPATHGAVILGEACVHFWNGELQRSANWIYFDIDNLDAMYERAKNKDVEIARAPEDYPWGLREFNAVDLNGYNIRFGQHLGR